MFYNLAISLYEFAAKVAALFSSKPAKMLEGQKRAFMYLLNNLDPYDKHIWVHAASLGEFEQGRPLIERIRKDYPKYKIVLTFFSPSGYEVRKDYKGADYVCYLPFDTPDNAMMFVRIVKPVVAYFIKYEFWRNYLRELHKNDVPAYSISSIFRPNQIFFRWYGKSYREVLHCFDHFFVQNEESKKLLFSAGVTFSTVVGDTRFDRVLDIRAEAQPLPLVERFKGDALTLVAGSSWGPDEDIIISYFNAHPEMKLVIAPHVVSDSHLKEIESKLKRPFVRYTQATEESVQQADCLIIDCYGLLSSIYRYGEISYVGGGFGVGIHNVLEAAVYGIPVIFGPKNKKFREARHLLEQKGGFEIRNSQDFETLMNRFLSDKVYLQTSGKAAGDYVKNNSGALEKIMEYMKL
jgi:3-deoxy-D-manno-octulosonic-acid transferase